MSEAVNLYEEEQEEQLEQDVPVLDDMDAEYLMGRIRAANAQYARMEAWYAKQLEKAKALRDRTVLWAEGNLRVYFDSVDTKKKTKTQVSYELPSGKLVLKHQEPKFETQDAELVPWLKQNGLAEMVETKESAKWGELKKTLTLAPDGMSMLTGDGEVVPGVVVTPREDKFTVTVK